jgi:dolichol-phosphate mannosyltransferase
MSGDIIREALIRVTKWGLRRRGNQVRGLFRRGV